MIGEFERTFTAGQASSIIVQLHAYGIDIWLPEVDGPVDLTDPTHRAVLQLLGHPSPARSPPRSPAHHGGDGRSGPPSRPAPRWPPTHGYRLVDAGPHPT
jgi:hypothetical protein